MGKATRWLRGLLGMKKDKEKNNSTVSDKKEKKKRSPVNDSDGLNQNIPATDTAWLRSYIAESENKHAIAVAADAAVAVVRLKSHGGGGGGLFVGGRERWAAVMVQAVFRGCLARKALRALKGLVKLQAHVRVYLVRKRATATLHSMQALIRAQAAVRSQRARRSVNAGSRFQPEMRARNSNFVFGDLSQRPETGPVKRLSLNEIIIED